MELVEYKKTLNCPSETEICRSRMPVLRRLIHKILPRHAYRILRFELALARVRMGHARVRSRYRGAHDLLVNIAPGPHGCPGWVNVDIGPWANVNCIYDCRLSLPFPDSSVRGIFCEHFVEHLDYHEEIPFFLRECWRTLKPGGTMRIIVPDAERYLRAYAENWSELEQIRGLSSGRTDPYTGVVYRSRMEIINHIFRQGSEHKFAYDFETLRLQLLSAGFHDVQNTTFGVSSAPELVLDQANRASESLYVEAIKNNVE